MGGGGREGGGRGGAREDECEHTSHLMNRKRSGCAGISSGAWSRRRGSGEDQAFGGRQGLLCLVQEAGHYPKSSGQPLQSFGQGCHAQVRT